MKGKSLLFQMSKSRNLPDGVSKSQRKRIENGYQIIKDHLTEMDINGAIRDIKGDPILNSNGVPFQHYKEVEDAINGLRKNRDSLIKSNDNPNLTPEVRKSINNSINDFDETINKWDIIKKGDRFYAQYY